MTLTRTLFLTFGLALLACGGCTGESYSPGVRSSFRPAPEAPVVILGLDTVRGDHLHTAGNGNLHTPHLNALAADGVLFARCQSTAPWTAPAFASLMTGLTPYSHGYVGGLYLRLDDEFETLAERLQDAGYQTGAFVSIDWLTADFVMAQGFATHTFFAPSAARTAI